MARTRTPEGSKLKMQPKGRNENWSAPVRSTCGRMQDTFARVLQDLFERFAGNAFDEWLDEPSQPGGNPGRERNRFRLHVSAAVAFTNRQSVDMPHM